MTYPLKSVMKVLRFLTWFFLLSCLAVGCFAQGEDYVGTDDWLGRTLYDVKSSEEALHDWMQSPLVGAVSVLGTATGIVLYTRCYYSNTPLCVHPAQAVLTTSAYIWAYREVRPGHLFVGGALVFSGLWQAYGVNEPEFGEPFTSKEPSSFELWGVNFPKLFAGHRRTQIILGLVVTFVPVLMRHLNRNDSVYLTPTSLQVTL